MMDIAISPMDLNVKEATRDLTNSINTLAGRVDMLVSNCGNGISSVAEESSQTPDEYAMDDAHVTRRPQRSSMQLQHAPR